MTTLDDMAEVWRSNRPPYEDEPDQSIIDIFNDRGRFFGAVEWRPRKNGYAFFPVIKTNDHEYTHCDLYEVPREYFELKNYLRSLGIRHLECVFKAEKFKIEIHPQLPRCLIPQLVEPVKWKPLAIR